MVVILGGGIAGLASAYYLLPKLTSKSHLKNKTITIYEASNRLGGWIKSQLLNDGTIFEQGPHSIRATGAPALNTLHLLDEIGLSEKVIPAPQTAQKKLIYSDGKVHVVPDSISGLFQKSSLLGKRPIALLLQDLKPTFSQSNDESVYDFSLKRFGPEVAQKLICPMICGIFAGDAREISMKSFNKQMFELQRKYGSLTLGAAARLPFNIITKMNSKAKEDPNSLVGRAKSERWRMLTLQGGLEELPKRLTEVIESKGVEIYKDHKCEEIKFHKQEIHYTVNGETRKCNKIISALPARNTAKLLQEQHPSLAKLLTDIPTITVAIVNFKFPKNILDTNAFGILVDPAEKLPILGVIFDHCIYPQESTVLTVMMGGAWFEKYFGKTPEKEYLLKVARDGLEKILNIQQQASVENVSILKDCIPQYQVGHSNRQAQIADYCREHRLPISICGSSYHGVGVNDVILSAKMIFHD